MLARNSDLYLEVSASCCALSSSACRACSTSRFLRLHLLVLVREQPRLFLQLLVGLLQLFLPASQLLGQRLRLLEQVLRAHVGLDGVDHDADTFRQLLEERLVRLAEAFERGQLDHGLHLALEHDGQHQDIARRRAAQPRGDADVVGRHIGEQDFLLGDGALADQSLRPGRGACRARCWPSDA